MSNIDWMLTNDIEVTKSENGSYLVREDGGERQCIITIVGDKMLFDGEFIETEDFMAFVGMLDRVDESPTGETVRFKKGE